MSALSRIPSSEYHVPEIGVVSKSALDQVARSPKHYRAWLDGAGKDSAALSFGRALHCAILEPDVFATDYAVEPDFGDCRKTDNKKVRDAWRAKNVHAELVSADSYEAIQAMADSVRAHPLASRMLTGGEPEVTARWVDEETGLKCKCRADYFVEKRRMIIDVKSTEDARPEAFRRSVWSYRYHVQDPIYRAGFAAAGHEIEHFLFLVVEKTPPHAVAIYSLDDVAREKGFQTFREGVATMAECMKTGVWPAYSESIQVLELPKWAA